jgi:putative endonuclease
MWYCYIVANKRNGTIYIWVTSLLEKRILEHKQWTYDWFTKKYSCFLLVWYQEFSTITEAIEYEKKLKWRNRNKKVQLIEQQNSERNDLF